MKTFAMTLAVLCLAGSALAGSTIERACLNSDRNPGRSLCGCIQKIADVKLSSADQRLAAKFFRDPHLAQETRQSNNAAKERFWKRYRDFGETAEQNCS